MRARAAVLAAGVVLAVLAAQVHLLLAVGPLLVLGAPAGLLLWAGRGGRDPYDVSARYGAPPLGDSPEGNAPKRWTTHQ